MIKRDAETNEINVHSQWLTDSLKGVTLSQALLQLIVDHCFMSFLLEHQIKGVHVSGMTEYSKDGMTFRCHPCYKNEQPWYDYVMVAWIDEGSIIINDTSPESVEIAIKTGKKTVMKRALLIPAKLLCIIKDDDNEVYAIVHSCLQYRKKTSVLTYRWQLEYARQKIVKTKHVQYSNTDNYENMIPVYHKVSIDAVHKHCLMLPFHHSSQYLMEVIDQEHWASAFSTV